MYFLPDILTAVNILSITDKLIEICREDATRICEAINKENENHPCRQTCSTEGTFSMHTQSHQMKENLFDALYCWSCSAKPAVTATTLAKFLWEEGFDRQAAYLESSSKFHIFCFLHLIT